MLADRMLVQQKCVLRLKCLVVAVALSMAAACGWGREAADFAGHYVWHTNAVEATALAQEVDAAVAGLNFLIRPIGRPRLAKSAAPYPAIDITVSNAAIRLMRAGAPALEGQLNGAAVKGPREEGASRDIAFAMTPDGQLQQTCAEADGARTNLFTLSADGQGMTMHVTISSKRLKHALVYDLTYIKR